MVTIKKKKINQEEKLFLVNHMVDLKHEICPFNVK